MHGENVVTAVLFAVLSLLLALPLPKLIANAIRDPRYRLFSAVWMIETGMAVVVFFLALFDVTLTRWHFGAVMLLGLAAPMPLWWQNRTAVSAMLRSLYGRPED